MEMDSSDIAAVGGCNEYKLDFETLWSLKEKQEELQAYIRQLETIESEQDQYHIFLLGAANGFLTGSTEEQFLELLQDITEKVVFEDVSDELKMLYDQHKDSILLAVLSTCATTNRSLRWKNDEVVDPRDILRVADIRFGVEKETLLYDFDLNKFTERVKSLFHWHTNDDERKKYMAPYFPMVQSSGMGKTKLFVELKKTIAADYKCRVILCVHESSNKSLKPYTDELVIPKEGSLRDIQKRISSSLNNILDGCTKSKIEKTTHNVIFLIDESQHLLKSDGFAFRCVRWWLRKKRVEKHAHVVAVFAGTTSRLTNFYRESKTSTTYSRDPRPSDYHDLGTLLYKPFFEINTIGVFAAAAARAANALMPDASPFTTDYDRAIPHGRPLFALMQESKDIYNTDSLFSILRRMLLSVPIAEWHCNLSACLSILGTRVQMGQTTTALSSELVSRGYATLTHYSAADTDEGSDNIAQIAFMTDPVCARLAMCLMDECWILKNDSGVELQGRTKLFWVQKMSEMFCTGICKPNQGDLGEIAAAIFLLFCGDLKRKDNYDCFSVSVADLVGSILKNSNDAKTKKAADEETKVHQTRSHDQVQKAIANPAFKDAHVSFIQVVRCYLRFSMYDIGKQDVLRDMYESGCAYYLYPGFSYIDMVASIRLTPADGGPIVYVPMLVSVTTKEKVGSEIVKLEDMKSLLKDVMPIDNSKQCCGLCIQLVFDSPNTKPIRCELLTENDVKLLLCPSIVSKVVVVNENDDFGIVKSLLRTTSMGPARAEVYSSHKMMNIPSLKNVKPKSLVRIDPADELVTFITELSNRRLSPRKTKYKKPN